LILRLKGLLDTPIDVALDTSSHFLSEIETAINRRGTLLIRYLSSSDDAAKDREIHPLTLTREGQHIYLSAFCKYSQAHRSFRLDRIEAVTPIKGEINEKFSEQIKKIEEAKGEEDATAPSKVKLKIKRNKRRYAELLNIENIPASGQVEIEVYSQAWLVRAISAARGEIEIVAGAEIAALIGARATQILSLYRS
jgi:proteasome accessory factor C